MGVHACEIGRVLNVAKTVCVCQDVLEAHGRAGAMILGGTVGSGRLW